MDAGDPHGESLTEKLAWAQQIAERQPCPLCGSHRRAVHWFCDALAKDCFFVLRCEVCGDVRLA